MQLDLLPGWARKLSIPLVVLAFLGWVLFIIGFTLYNNSDAFEDQQDDALEDNGTDIEEGVFEDDRADVYYFPYWCVIVAGPLLFINLGIHLVVGRWFTGILTNFLAGLYLVSAGGVLYEDGISLFSELNYDDDDITDKDDRLYILIEWVGCLISALFLTLHMTVWPLFSQPKRDDIDLPKY